MQTLEEIKTDAVSMRHHAMRLAGINPTDTKKCIAWHHDGTKTEFVVTADQCVTTSTLYTCWSTFRLTDYASPLFPAARGFSYID